MYRLAFVVSGGLLVAGFAMAASTPADAGKSCYSASGTAGWFNEKYAGETSVRRLNHAIDAEARKKKWKVVYVTKPATSCSKPSGAWYKCTSTATSCSSK